MASGNRSSGKSSGKKDPREHGTYVRRALMETPAFRALSPKAQILLLWLKLEWKGAKFNNNGKIRLSVRQAAERLGVTINTAASAFRELQAKGFIVVTQMGSLGVEGEARGPSYELTEHPLPSSGEAEGQKLFLQWKPGSDFQVVRHNVNNPTGRNGRRVPASEKQKPVSKDETVLS